MHKIAFIPAEWVMRSVSALADNEVLTVYSREIEVEWHKVYSEIEILLKGLQNDDCRD